MSSQVLSRRGFLRVFGVGIGMTVLAACGGAASQSGASTAAAPGQQPTSVTAATPAGQSAAATTAAPVAETQTPPAASAGKTVLRVQANPDEEKPTEDLFIQQHPDVAFDNLSITGIDHEEVASKILSMVAAGQPIDLGYAATEATQLYAGQGLSLALDDYVKRDADTLKEYFADVHPSLVEAMMYEGSLYQLPFDFNAANMYYNTKVFAEAGFKHPADDWSKDDFYNIAKTLTKKDSSGQATAFGYGWINRLWGSWMPWIFVNGGNLLTEERAPGGAWLWDTFYKDDPAAKGRGGGWRWRKPKANDPANVEALDFMVQLYNEGITPAVELGGGGTLQGFFSSGKLAMTPAGGFWSGGLHNAGMKRGDFDVQLFPKWKNQRHQFGTASLFIFKQSPHKDLAWEYYKVRISKEGMKVHGVFNPVTLTTPTRRSMMTAERFAETGPEHWQVFYDTLDKHPDTAPIPAPPVSNAETTLFTSYTAKAMALEMKPQEALDALQKELEALFARNPKMYPAE